MDMDEYGATLRKLVFQFVAQAQIVRDSRDIVARN